MTIQHQQQPEPISLGYHESLGMMMWLMKHADYHGQWPLWSVDNDIIPALIHGQCKLYFDDNQNPVGFATWAWLDDEAKEQALSNSGPLEVNQWNSGEHLMIADFVAPWGHAKIILSDLRANMFAEYRVFSLGRNPDGSIRKVYYWKGNQFKGKVTNEQRVMNMKLWARQKSKQ